MGGEARPPRVGPVVVAIVALAQVACFGGSGRPTHLIDGSPAEKPSVLLEGTTSPQVEADAAAFDPRNAVTGPIARCLAATREYTPRAPVILRIGVDGANVTFHTAFGDNLVACDGTAVAPDSPSRSWCGLALGRVHAGRLLDPRLELAGCSTSSGRPIAFAWIEPGRRTRYVALHRNGFVEVYPVLARLPVRVATTSDIDLDTSSASFEVSDHDADGRRIRAYTLDAHVAG